MTNDQWNNFEASLSLAPEITQAMYTTTTKEMTQQEVVDLSRCLLTVTSCLARVAEGQMTNPNDLADLSDLTLQMLSGLYGRLLGLAKAYDALVTKQVMMEAELASAGK